MAMVDLKSAEAAQAKAEAARKAALDNVDTLVAAAKADLQKQLDTQEANAKATAADYAKQLKDAEADRLAEVAKREAAVAAATAKADRELAAREAEFQKRLARQAEDFEAKMSDLRAGSLVPLSNGERADQERAARAFSNGVVAYQTGRYPTAEAQFVSATEDDDGDARYWYYLGLSRWAQGNSTEAETAFKKGAELESRSRPSSAVVAASLERVQGAARRVLAAHRP